MLAVAHLGLPLRLDALLYLLGHLRDLVLATIRLDLRADQMVHLLIFGLRRQRRRHLIQLYRLLQEQVIVNLVQLPVVAPIVVCSTSTMAALRSICLIPPVGLSGVLLVDLQSVILFLSE